MGDRGKSQRSWSRNLEGSKAGIYKFRGTNCGSTVVHCMTEGIAGPFCTSASGMPRGGGFLFCGSFESADARFFSSGVAGGLYSCLRSSEVTSITGSLAKTSDTISEGSISNSGHKKEKLSSLKL